MTPSSDTAVAVSTPSAEEVAAIAQVDFRSSVALFATGIAVVTADDGNGGVHGVTVNSFTSISLDPPTVMVSLRAGRAHELISKNAVFGVSVLTEAQQNHSRYFTGKRDDDWAPEFLTGSIVPTLAGSLARFECRVTQTIDVHDHTLFLARVERCESDAGSPLMFFASNYHRPVLALPEPTASSE